MKSPNTLKTLTLCASLLITAGAMAATQSSSAPSTTPTKAQQQNMDQLKMLSEGNWRDDKNKARNVYRNPVETLTFFGITPQSKVLEIWPGGGWYAEILVPYTAKKGAYVGAVNDPATMTNERSKEYFGKQNKALSDKFAANPEIYQTATLLPFDPSKPVLGKPGSLDAVLTFRNVHNWRGNKQAEGMFKAFYEVLKKGGTLGVVEHRAAQDVAVDDKSGYVSEAQVIALAEQAGFKLVARSEINANPKDTKDYADGVWTLPPTYRLGDKDREKYAAIGESDRMTLKFMKP